MILHSLVNYYNRLVEEDASDAPPEGFQFKEIRFVIVLSPDGSFVELLDTADESGKSARSFLVPREEKRSGKNAWQKSNLLWDNEGYVLGYSRDGSDKGSKQHQSFKDHLSNTFTGIVDDGITAVNAFLKKGNFSPVFSHPLWPEVEKKSANFTFQLRGDTGLVCQRPEVRNAISRRRETTGGQASLQCCLITGETDSPSRIHAAIKGVWGAQTSGANIVSFNLPAFNSYMKEQGLNAPVGSRAEFAYVTALNTLLAKGSRHRLQVGDATTVFWAARATPMEDVFADFFGIPAKGAAQDLEAVRMLFSAPQSGAIPLDEDLTPFFVLGLAPNASRISIRFWYEGTVALAARSIRQHFDDLRIVHGPGDPEFTPLWRLLKSTARLDQLDNVIPSLAGEMMKAILSGTPYPRTVLSALIGRIRADRMIGYERASLLKAFLTRAARFYRKDTKEVSMSLDLENTSIGYLLGRLFAVLERAQETASPGLNATIRDRFYGAASSTPATVFPHLLKLKNHHISKIDNRGAAINLEKQTGQIMDGISDFPPHLSLEDQGRFAIGYYHQRQEFFTKKTEPEAVSSANG